MAEHLTWSEARDAIIEPTAIGWTQKSADRIWLIVTVENSHEPGSDLEPYNGNWVYLAEKHSSYELWDKELCFLSRREAEAYIATMPEKFRQYWHPVNLGDMLRQERAYLDGKPVGLHGEGFTPKFRGSDAAFELMREVARRA